MRDHGAVEAGQSVLIVGASGGVGSFAVQIAKAYGADVTGVSGTAKVDPVRALGADHVIDYTREDFADGQHRYDVILDIGGNRRLSHLRRALTPREDSSSSEARPMVGGWAVPTANCGRSCCPSSSARNWAPSSRRRTPQT